MNHNTASYHPSGLPLPHQPTLAGTAAVARFSGVMEFSGVTELCRGAEQAGNNADSIQTTLQSITNFRLTLLMNLHPDHEAAR